MRLFKTPFLMLCPALLSTVALAQIPPNTFKHIIIIVQENRTPDNLFGSYVNSSLCGGTASFPGADINNFGYTFNGAQRVQICNASQPMNNSSGDFDPGHQYEDWTADYDGGSPGMDGFCHGLTYAQCITSPSPYSHIQTSDVGPYFSIATTYGFANYMFQTNEGPSFPAHQFLFSGTSAPVAPNDSSGYYWDFVRDNPPQSSEFDTSGCPYDAGGGYPPAPWIQPDRTFPSTPLPSLRVLPAR